MPQTAAQPNETAIDLESLVADVVAMAMKAGASDAEAVAREGDEFSVNVRMGEVETLKESGSRGLGLRVFRGKRTGSASTSDLTAEGIRQHGAHFARDSDAAAESVPPGPMDHDQGHEPDDREAGSA
jgi:PmbA protein